MKYYGTFACGHEGEVSLIGKNKDREWKLKRAFNGVCQECYDKAKQKENDEIQEQAKQYVELIGTIKQVEWANKIRSKYLEQLSSISAELFTKFANTALDPIDAEKVLNTDIETIKYNLAHYITKAETFIDARDKNVLKLLSENIDLLCNSKEVNEDNKKLLEEIKEEKQELYLLETENKTKDGIVIVSENEGTIKLTYQYDRDFIDIVKSYQYYWDRPYWARRSSDIENNMAEVTSKLLENGFSVQLENLKAMDLVKNNSYKRENFNRISYANGRFLISWNGFDNRIYLDAKDIPTAKWSSTKSKMVVSTRAINELLEFALINKFNFDESAKTKIENLRVEKIIVDVAGDPITKTGLEEILNGSLDILDDLKDED